VIVYTTVCTLPLILVNVSVIPVALEIVVVSPVTLILSAATQLKVPPTIFTSAVKSCIKATSLQTVSTGAIAL